MLGKLKEKLAKFHRDERGAMSVEMMLILAAVGIPVLIILILFSGRIIEWFRGKEEELFETQ